ncbi:MAG: type II toxin-antitoxin system RelE/ParE family toxin [Cyanothece sp. SIO2G6]|nr:type II toxin-antitoxin system RelE/ParE family toxin [Cyanothece sp. SIO2G6]
MSEDVTPVQINFTDDFKRQLRKLAKRYRNIRQDIQPLLDQLQAGNFVGEQIQGIGYPVFKVRVSNSDIQKGKSGGYRVLYYLATPHDVLLLLIYSKMDKADIAANVIRDILKEYYE